MSSSKSYSKRKRGTDDIESGYGTELSMRGSQQISASKRLQNLPPASYRSRMKRNPFTKEDSGCTFCCFLGTFIIIQVLYNYMFVVPAYKKDHR